MRRLDEAMELGSEDQCANAPDEEMGEDIIELHPAELLSPPPKAAEPLRARRGVFSRLEPLQMAIQEIEEEPEVAQDPGAARRRRRRHHAPRAGRRIQMLREIRNRLAQRRSVPVPPPPPPYCEPWFLPRLPGCYNCGGSHHYATCPWPRNVFCYKCGIRKVTLKNCPKCKVLWRRRGAFVRALNAHVPWDQDVIFFNYGRY